MITTNSIVFFLSYKENNSPVRIKNLFGIIFFYPLNLRERTNYSNISFIYIYLTIPTPSLIRLWCICIRTRTIRRQQLATMPTIFQTPPKTMQSRRQNWRHWFLNYNPYTVISKTIPIDFFDTDLEGAAVVGMFMEMEATNEAAGLHHHHQNTIRRT